MKHVIGNQEEASREITVYTAKWCGACKKHIPQILKKAEVTGIRVKLIDWDDDLSDEERERLSERVEFVPYIDYMGREIDEEELDLICLSHKSEEELK